MLQLWMEQLVPRVAAVDAEWIPILIRSAKLEKT